jgi:hypothetical protein
MEGIFEYQILFYLLILRLLKYLNFVLVFTGLCGCTNKNTYDFSANEKNIR